MPASSLTRARRRASWVVIADLSADLRRARVAQTTNSTSAMNQADSMASSVGVMHALRTGNPIVDMLIAMSVPVLFKFAMDAVRPNQLVGDDQRAALLLVAVLHARARAQGHAEQLGPRLQPRTRTSGTTC